MSSLSVSDRTVSEKEGVGGGGGGGGRKCSAERKPGGRNWGCCGSGGGAGGAYKPGGKSPMGSDPGMAQDWEGDRETVGMRD